MRLCQMLGRLFFSTTLRISNVQIAISLFLISLIIRIGFLMPVVIFDVPPVYDEAGYYSRAVCFENILGEVLSGHLPSTTDLGCAYGGGRKTPLHPFFLALGLFIFGEEVAVARHVVVILSSLTTPLVYILTLKLSTRKAAIWAAFLHIFYPSFIAYSHYLWSETTYILFILSCVYFTVLILEARTHRKKILYATLSGCFLGLSGLTRAAALPFLLIIPLWLALSSKEIRIKILLPSTVIISWFIILLPWLSALALVEKRFVPISANGGITLYYGNNPWVPDGFGSSYGHRKSRVLMDRAMNEYSKLNLVDKDVAARTLALQNIKQDVKKFLIRCVYRLRMLWTSDFFILRHMFHTVYPPMPSIMIILIWIITLSSYIALVTLAVWGFFGADSQFYNKKLILASLVAGMIPPTITLGISRFHLPLLALLLPLAGHSIVNLKQKVPFKRVAPVILITVLLSLSILTTLPIVVSTYLVPSSYYNKLIGRINSIFDTKIFYTDQIIFINKDIDVSDRLDVTISSDSYWFYTSKSQDYYWEISPENRVLVLDIVSQNPTQPLEISLFSEESEQSVVIQPINRLFWRQWQSTGLSRIEYMWAGGGKTPDDR